MSKLVNRAVVLLVMCAVMGVAAAADTITEKVTFHHAVKVNGTLVKAGTYKVVFDDQTDELTIFKGKKVIAETQARIEKLERDSRSAYSFHANSSDLLSVNLRGSRAVIQNGGEGGERSQ